jgi:hypothetical protein
VDQLLEGLGELIFYLVILAGAFLLMLMFGIDEADEGVIEILMIPSGLVVCLLVGIVMLIHYLVKCHKRAKELKKIYKLLKPKYNLTLMTVTRKKDDQMVDFPIIRGKRPEGKFELSKDGDGFIFSVERLSGPIEGRKSETRLTNSDEAIEYIEKFMSGEERN